MKLLLFLFFLFSNSLYPVFSQSNLLESVKKNPGEARNLCNKFRDFNSKGIKFLRANVGDRYVKEKMLKYNFNLGGEQSGHIILGNFATTGDGLLVALEALFALRKGKKASEFFEQFKKTPQVLKNIEVKDKNIIGLLPYLSPIIGAPNLLKILTTAIMLNTPEACTKDNP